MRVGTQGLFRLCLKTFVAPFLPARLTAPGSPRMLCIRTLIKLSYHTSSVEAVNSQVIFFFYDNIQLFLSFLLNFYFNFFICYCFGTEIFMSKIKSIKLLLFFLMQYSDRIDALKASNNDVNSNRTFCMTIKWSFHFKPRANGRNIVGCYMLRPFAHPVACCWMLLRVVVQSLKSVKLFSQQLPTFFCSVIAEA